jgi:hypothetical protein
MTRVNGRDSQEINKFESSHTSFSMYMKCLERLMASTQAVKSEDSGTDPMLQASLSRRSWTCRGGYLKGILARRTGGGDHGGKRERRKGGERAGGGRGEAQREIGEEENSLRKCEMQR